MQSDCTGIKRLISIVFIQKKGIASIVLLFIISIPITLSQSPTCNGISISYLYNSGFQIPPATTLPANQPYNFQSTLTLTNAAQDRLKSWRLFVAFQHREFLVSSSNAVLADGTSLPANVISGAVFAGFPVTDLKTADETAGDFNQMQAMIQLVGTQFGSAPPNIPLPSTMYLIFRKYNLDGSNCIEERSSEFL